MIFKTNRENSLSSYLEPKIIEFEKCLMQWRHRKLTLMGKIGVIFQPKRVKFTNWSQFLSHKFFGLDFHFYVIFLLIGICQLDNDA